MNKLFDISRAESKERTWKHYGFDTPESRKGYVLHHIDEDMIKDDPKRHDMFYIEDCVPMSASSHLRHHRRTDSKGEQNPFYGKHHSAEIKSMLSEMHKGNKYWVGRHHSEETKEKLRSNRPNACKVVQVDKDGNIVATFKSVCEASRETGILRETISKCLRGARKTAGGYVWKKAV